MVQQVVLECSHALTTVQQALTRWQVQLHAPPALLGLMVDQVALEWQHALATVQQAHTR